MHLYLVDFIFVLFNLHFEVFVQLFDLESQIISLVCQFFYSQNRFELLFLKFGFEIHSFISLCFEIKLNFSRFLLLFVQIFRKYLIVGPQGYVLVNMGPVWPREVFLQPLLLDFRLQLNPQQILPLLSHMTLLLITSISYETHKRLISSSIRNFTAVYRLDFLLIFWGFTSSRGSLSRL